MFLHSETSLSLFLLLGMFWSLLVCLFFNTDLFLVMILVGRYIWPLLLHHPILFCLSLLILLASLCHIFFWPFVFDHWTLCPITPYTPSIQRALWAVFWSLYYNHGSICGPDIQAWSGGGTSRGWCIVCFLFREFTFFSSMKWRSLIYSVFVGEPIAGALLGKYSDAYWKLLVFTGIMSIAESIFVFIAKLLINKNIFASVWSADTWDIGHSEQVSDSCLILEQILLPFFCL